MSRARRTSEETDRMKRWTDATGRTHKVGRCGRRWRDQQRCDDDESAGDLRVDGTRQRRDYRGVITIGKERTSG